jgi:hypothetical protein
MEKRLKNYLAYISGVGKDLNEEERSKIKRDMLVQIGFFQHERLIHLLVTITFAILLMMTVIATLFVQEIALYILILLLLVLLLPYIKHYYVLENGVQKLYQYYDEM